MSAPASRSEGLAQPDANLRQQEVNGGMAEDGDWAHNRKAYKYGDRGDGIYERYRHLSGHAHLVQSGKHAGRSNVKYVGPYSTRMDNHLWKQDFFTSVASMRFGLLCLLMLLVYALSYFLFAILWYIIWELDEQCLEGVSNFNEVYMFSAEMQATIGFGTRAAGDCVVSALLLTFQNVFGMILDALSLGIIFAKISHPKFRGRSIFISECATIARRDGILKLMIRVGDIRGHTACEANVKAYLFTWGGHQTLEGESLPVRSEQLSLPEISGRLVVPMVLEHTIDERSPLHNLSHDALVALGAEVIVVLQAVSDFGDSFLVRRSYLPDEMHWGRMFVPITSRAVPGALSHNIDLSRFHDVVVQPGLPNLPPGPLSRHILAGRGAGIRPPLPFPALGENTLVVSEGAAIAPRGGASAPAFSFRVGDTRPGQVVEARVRAYLFEWATVPGGDAREEPYSVQELEMGYDTGKDRLVLRFPEVVSHAIAPGSPLARWADARGAPSTPAEVLVIVEAMSYPTSENLVRSRTFQLPGDVAWGKAFAPCISRGARDAAEPRVDWRAFHALLAPGEVWKPPDAAVHSGTPQHAGGAASASAEGVAVEMSGGVAGLSSKYDF